MKKIKNDVWVKIVAIFIVLLFVGTAVIVAVSSIVK